MNVFGVGLPELILIFIVAMIVLGPRNIVTSSRKLSESIRKLVTSETWQSVIKSTQEIRDIQGQILEDTGLPESIKTLQNSTRDLVTPSIPKWNPPSNNTIAPPPISLPKELENNSSEIEVTNTVPKIKENDTLSD